MRRSDHRAGARPQQERTDSFLLCLFITVHQLEEQVTALTRGVDALVVLHSTVPQPVELFQQPKASLTKTSMIQQIKIIIPSGCPGLSPSSIVQNGLLQATGTKEQAC